MAADRLTIDPASVFDDIDARTVEFDAIVDEERRAFAVQYDVLRALSGDEPADRAVALFQHHADRIAEAAAVALARDIDQERVIVSENDLG
ncbi:hypothetical protein GCM10011380_12390 [Sphingomonas metalli]|uniref:DUF1488 family protein n=1 Tax=Sphingomonas metalli TaxID=1779358 RepID=A0A916T1B8_9SPHN|nr:DUF1488 family protein [Sphingomonas metalli]GGB24364.1 hypothetical protein GCM10011380_12390 [Sphingomonas metalli]